MSVRLTESLQTATTSRFGWEIVHWIGIWAADYARPGRTDKPWRAIELPRPRRLASRTERLVLPDRIELSTSPLPRDCYTTELRQRAAARIGDGAGDGANIAAGCRLRLGRRAAARHAPALN